MLVVVYVVMASLEIVRLYLGYSGNLQEKVRKWFIDVANHGVVIIHFSGVFKKFVGYIKYWT